MSAVVDPLAARLQQLGGVIRTGSRVARVVIDGGRARGVIVGDETPLSRTTIDWGSGETAFIDIGGVPVFCRRHRQDDGSVAVAAFDLRCTHQGCPVVPQPPGQGFACPCHGGMYDDDGVPIAGPPPAPLRRLPILHEHGADIVVEPAHGGEQVDADVVIVACDTRGTRDLLVRSALQNRIDLAALAESEPFCIARLWLDRPVRADRAPFYTTSRFAYLDSLAIYSHFQRPFVDDAVHGGGSVVELHAYAIPPERQAPPDVIADAMAREMLVVLPELTGARVRHREVQLQASFTRFAPGDHAHRPRTDSGVPGLLFAADWVKIDAPVALMEGATVAGKLAANHVLRAHHLAAESVPIVAPRGPLA